MFKQGAWRLAPIAFVSLTAACSSSSDATDTRPVGFASEGADAVRHAACTQDHDNATRIGAGAVRMNATNLWSVTPYLVLIPASGQGYVTVNVDAPRFDWLLYTTSDVALESLDGPALERSGSVSACPERDLIEYGAYQGDIRSWALRVTAEPGSRAPIYAAPSPTEHSDLAHAGHAAHVLAGGHDAGAHQ